MGTKLSLRVSLAAFIACACLTAQTPQGQSTSSASSDTTTPTPAPTAGKSSSEGSRESFVRRISADATLSVLGLSLVPKGSETVTNSASVNTAYDTTGKAGRVGYGGMVQLALTDHFSIAAQALLRRIGYQMTTTVSTTTTGLVSGVVTTNTATTTADETTSARLIEIPLVLRYYHLDRHTRGPRWFVEGGSAWRDARSIHSSISTTDTTGVMSCCNTSPVSPAHGSTVGIVAGAGVQLIDPVGIHVIPEVEYTRWANPIFNVNSTGTRRDEIAIGISLGF